MSRNPLLYLLALILLQAGLVPSASAQEEDEPVSLSIVSVRPGDHGTVVLMLSNCHGGRGIGEGDVGYFPEVLDQHAVTLTRFVGAARCEATTELNMDLVNAQNHVVFGGPPPAPPEPIVAHIEGSPSRASVTLDGEEVCDGLPCEITLPDGEGPVEVVVSRRRYESQTLTLEREPDRTYEVELER